MTSFVQHQCCLLTLTYFSPSDSDSWTQQNLCLPSAFSSISQRLKEISVETTVKILKIGTPKIITVIFLPMEQLDFTVQYWVHKMQAE